MGRPMGLPDLKALAERSKDYTDDQVADLKGYIGYTDSDIYGLEADFENNKFTRLAGAVEKTPGADFDNINAFGGRKRCCVKDNGEVVSYYGDNGGNYENDGYINNLKVHAQSMVEQPKFYYKVVPLKIEKIDGADGYHLRKARYYISDTPKPGFKVHPAFMQNGIETDKIYLSAFEGSIRSKITDGTWVYFKEDEQTTNFDTDILSSVSNAKPASGTTQALTRANARKLAQNRGAGWGITTIQTLSATQLLFAIEYATFNSQTAIGNGVVNATEPIKTGSTRFLGNTSGSVASGGVSYRGEENLWGNIMKWLDNAEVVKDSDNYCLYINETKSNISYKSLNGYISAFEYDENFDFCFAPGEVTGNSALPIGDSIVCTSSNNTSLIRTSDIYSAHTTCGLFYNNQNSNELDHAFTTGARLIYIPTQEVTAND